MQLSTKNCKVQVSGQLLQHVCCMSTVNVGNFNSQPRNYCMMYSTAACIALPSGSSLPQQRNHGGQPVVQLLQLTDLAVALIVFVPLGLLLPCSPVLHCIGQSVPEQFQHHRSSVIIHTCCDSQCAPPVHPIHLQRMSHPLPPHSPLPKGDEDAVPILADQRPQQLQDAANLSGRAALYVCMTDQHHMVL